MGGSPLQTMFVARGRPLKFDRGFIFRRVRQRGDDRQIVFLVAVNLVTGADPKPGSIQVTRFLVPVFHRSRPAFGNSQIYFHGLSIQARLWAFEQGVANLTKY